MGQTDSSQISALVARLQAGDSAAREELIRAAMGRLEGLARKMLRQFPGVRRWEDTADVVQNALLRLVRALQAVTPGSSRAFFGLAAEQIRRELLDLARHYGGPHGAGRHHRSNARLSDDGSGGLDPADPGPGPADLDRWAALHEAAERLPAQEREVFMLTFYHGWEQKQIADLFGIDERTVRRRWKEACRALAAELGGDLPAE